MITNYFLVALRSIKQNKLFIVINVCGMGIAIACCIVVYLAYQYDATFDQVHKEAEKVYRVSSVREFTNESKRFGYVPLPLGRIVDKTLQEVNRSSRFVRSQSNFKREDDLFPANLTYVDPDFFQMFSFNFIAGTPAQMDDKTSVLLSEEMAVRLFNKPKEAIGRTITQVFGTELKEVTVTGVFAEQPMNSSFYRRYGSAFMNFENYKDEGKDVGEDDWKGEATLFVNIDNPSSVDIVRDQIQKYTENNNKAHDEFKIKEFVLDPFVLMAHNDRTDNVEARTNPAPPSAAIIGGVIMGILILLIACFNLTNTAIAISSRRLKEIGIRKVMGSKRSQLVAQFIGETTLICFLGMLVGIGFSDMLIEGWNTITMNAIYLAPHAHLQEPSFIIFLIAVLLLTGVIAGSYPAFYISKFRPANILKGKVKFGGKNYFTRVLLGMQFAISLMAIVSAIGFFQNARYQQDYNLGFDIRGSIIASINGKSEFDTYKNALMAYPELVSISGAHTGIFTDRNHEAVEHESRKLEVDVIEVGDNYLQTMDLQLVDGRDFIRDSESDRNESIIITQKMADIFGWTSPLGKEIMWRDSVKLHVIGVIKNVYNLGLWKEMEPMMIKYVSPDKYSQIVVRAKRSDVTAANAIMSREWNKIFPNRLYNGRMLVADLQEINTLNSNIVNLYGFLGALALMLSATGLFTLVSLNIIRRMKEIGVRKILGASVPNITRIINMEFFVILGIASIFGSWAGFGWTNVIMSNVWEYYQGVNLMTFVMSIGIMLFIAMLTIGYKVITVSVMNPANILRDE